MDTELTGNARALAIATEYDCQFGPASRIVRDGHHCGTLFTWVERRLWVVYDLENSRCLGEHDRLAVVTVNEDEADRGLNQCCLACDLDVTGGEWVVDADELHELRRVYGDTLTVLWEQD